MKKAKKAKKTSKAKKPAAIRSDGRRALLLYFDPKVTKQLKQAALEDDRSAYDIAEEAILAWLNARQKT